MLMVITTTELEYYLLVLGESLKDFFFYFKNMILEKGGVAPFIYLVMHTSRFLHRRTVPIAHEAVKVCLLHVNIIEIPHSIKS